MTIAQWDENPLQISVTQAVAGKLVELLTGVLITHMNKWLLNQGCNCHASGLQYGQCFPPVFGHGIFSSFWQKPQFKSQH